MWLFSESIYGGTHARLEDMEDRDVVDEIAVRPPTGIGTGTGDRRESRYRFSALPPKPHAIGIGSVDKEIGKTGRLGWEL